MLWRDVINLISVTTTVNSLGDAVDTQTLTQVFANKKSIRQSEFYQAMANGLRPEIMFEIRYSDYNSEDKISYNGYQYDIIRVYTKNDEIIELVCNNLVNEVLSETLLFVSDGSNNFITSDNEIFRVRKA